jgi:hypothetical protein
MTLSSFVLQPPINHEISRGDRTAEISRRETRAGHGAFLLAIPERGMASNFGQHDSAA